MARKRMFSNDVLNSDPFYALSKDAKLAYIYLNLGADDDGFIATATKELYPLRIGETAVKELVEHGYLLEFDEPKVYVITHFFVHNTRRKDRYTPTYYLEVKEKLGIDKNGKYFLLGDEDVSPDIEQVSILVAANKSKLNKSKLDESNSTCTEPGNPPDSMLCPDIEGLLCTDGSYWYPTVKSFERYKTLYPGVDLQREFVKMAQWCIDNPKRRKTRSGCGRFVTNWLEKAQNSRWGKPKAVYSNPTQISYVKEQEELSKPAEVLDEDEEIRKTLEALKLSEGGE